jgi:hypothetical protein
MFSIWFIMFLSAILAVVQISIYKSLPHFLQKIFASSVLLGMIVNFLLSGIIVAFTAVGLFAGVANLFASVGFGVYLAMYKKKHKISGIRVKSRHGIPCGLYIEEANVFEHWLF